MKKAWETIKKNSSWKVILAIFGLVFFTFILISLFRLGSLFAFIWVFPWITQRLIFDAGMDIWLARCLAVGISAGVVYAIYLIFSWKKEKRAVGIVLLLSGFVAYSLTMFYMTKEYNFKPDGSSTKCVSITPNGIEYVSCNYSVHPIYGTKVQPLSKEIIISMETKKSGNIPKIKRIEPEEDMVFFAPDGTPLIWYYQHPDGKLEFFDQPGHHPQLNTILAPINPEIVKQFFEYLNEGKRDLILLNEQIADTDKSDSTGLEGLRNFLLTMKIRST